MAKTMKKETRSQRIYGIRHQAIESAFRARTPVAKLTKMMKRSEGSLRQKARMLGIGLGHQR
jgi:hypothetical protein